LAVLGAQVQQAQSDVLSMQRRMRAMMLAEQLLAELDMGLVDLESVDEVEEQDFGPRYPDFGWRLITEPSAIDNMFVQELQILYLPREGAYRENEFDHDNAEIVYTVHTLRSPPKPIDFATDFGLQEEDLTDLNDQLDELGIPDLDLTSFDPRFFQQVDFEELIKAAPVLLDALGLDIRQLTTLLPPDLLKQLQESGLLDTPGGGDQTDDSGDASGAQP
ncbi:MAG: hypothetical protein D6788_08220, partial [Planctomycetota bacterium]